MTEEKIPIEISETDIIRRPNETTPSAAPAKSPLSWVKEIKEGIGQVKEMMDMLKGLGINMSGFNPANPTSSEIQAAIGQPGQNEQLQLLLQLLKSRYGNMTIKQLMAAFLAEYGDRKLEDLIK